MQDATQQAEPFLDSIENNRNNFCGKWSVYTKLVTGCGMEFKYRKVGCKRWNCPRCGPRRARQLRHAIIRNATAIGLTRFLTLTLDPRSCTADQSVTYIRSCWAKFRTYLTRKEGEAITFISILEFQKNGYAHLHALVDRRIPFDWIQDAWQSVGGGKFVNITQADIHRIAAYLSKYLTKEILLSPHFGKFRRYTTSRSVVMFVKPQKGTWRLIMAPLEYLHELAESILTAASTDVHGALDEFTTSVPISP